MLISTKGVVAWHPLSPTAQLLGALTRQLLSGAGYTDDIIFNKCCI